MLNIILVIIASSVLLFMFHPRLTKSASWQATLTPLSSIIGSGFLIIAPLLASIVGIYSPLAVTGIVVLAYAIGAVWGNFVLIYFGAALVLLLSIVRRRRTYLHYFLYSAVRRKGRGQAHHAELPDGPV